MSQKAPPHALVRALTNNWSLKAIALVLSIALFALVHSDTDAQRAIYLDVVALLPPPSAGKMLTSELPAQVKVTLSGSRSKLSSLSRDDFGPIQMDLREASGGRYYLDPSAIDVGSGAQVTAITPAMVPLTWAPSGEKRVVVHVALEGQLKKSLSLRGEAYVEPTYVTLRGPVERLDGLTTVSTEPVSLLGVGLGEHRRRVPLEPLPEHVTYADDHEVEVRWVVEPAVITRTFTKLAVTAVGDKRLNMRPSQLSVTLRGPEDLLLELTTDQLVPYVDATEVFSGTRSLNVLLRGVPDGVEVASVTPASVLARIAP